MRIKYLKIIILIWEKRIKPVYLKEFLKYKDYGKEM